MNEIALPIASRPPYKNCISQGTEEIQSILLILAYCQRDTYEVMTQIVAS